MTKEQFGTDVPLYNKSFYNARGQLSEIRVGTTYTGATDTDFERGAIINHYSNCWGACSGPENNGNLKRQDHWVKDGNGVVVAINTQQFDYDSLNRIQRVKEGTSWQQEYVYDRYGNRSINPAGTTQGVGINSMQASVVANTTTNRMYAPGESEQNHPLMNYDAAGNQTKDYYSHPTLDYDRTYDAENRMKSSTATTGTQTSTYTYNADGQRVRRKIDNVETWQVYGINGELLAEYGTNASPLSPQKEYGYRNGQLLVTVTAAAAGWGAPPSFTPPATLVSGLEIKLEHLTELRSAVNQLRGHAGLSAATWTVDPNPVRYVTEAKADHILQLRGALEEARSHLGLSTGGYAHPGLHTGDPIFAIDFQELRNQILSAWNGGSSSVNINWLVADQLGTPRMIIDKTGSLAGVKRHDYLPFGEELFAGTGGRTTALGYSGDNIRQKFTQKERDNETGLDYFGARYYASMQGRFTGADPYDINLDRQETDDRQEADALFRNYIAQPQHWNRYAYALNNPLRYIDPDGLKSYEVTVLGQQVTVHIDDEIIKKDPGAYKRIQENLQKVFDRINAATNLSPEQIQSIQSQNQISVTKAGTLGTFGDTFFIPQKTAENPNFDKLTGDIIHDSRHSEQDKRGLSYNQKTVIPMEMEASEFTLGVMKSMGGIWDAKVVKGFERDAATGHIDQKGWKDKSTPESRAKVFSKMKGLRK